MLVVAIMIGGLSIYQVDKFVQKQSVDFVNATCSNETTKINDMFSDMEKSVNISLIFVVSFEHVALTKSMLCCCTNLST